MKFIGTIDLCTSPNHPQCLCHTISKHQQFQTVIEAFWCERGSVPSPHSPIRSGARQISFPSNLLKNSPWTVGVERAKHWMKRSSKWSKPPWSTFLEQLRGNWSLHTRKFLQSKLIHLERGAALCWKSDCGISRIFGVLDLVGNHQIVENSGPNSIKYWANVGSECFNQHISSFEGGLPV